MERHASDYWLEHCEGFRVEASGRRIGLVEDVLLNAEDNRPAAIMVAAGLRGVRTVVVPVEQIEAVQPRDERIRVSGPWPNPSHRPRRGWLVAPLDRLRDLRRRD
jgi:PRC-barrel domain